mgnify:CR=1 FL=1
MDDDGGKGEDLDTDAEPDYDSEERCSYLEYHLKLAFRIGFPILILRFWGFKI